MMKRFNLYFLVFLMSLISGKAIAQSSSNTQKFDKVVFDAGHGGYDSGARGKNSKEKNITLSIALQAGKMLQDELPDVEVIYTRSEDRFVKLHDRARIANESEADLFISIHCNSNISIEPFGTETYVMGLHKSKDNLEVAKAENAAILLEDNYHEQYDGFDPNLDEDYIMLNMFQSANIEQSLAFSQLLQNQMRHTAEMYDRGVRQAGFVVLYLTTMPGVLLEAGFLSNPGEEKFLMDEANQERIAKAIVEAIRIYKQEAELRFETISVHNNRIDIKDTSKPDKIYRIGFTNLKKEKPLTDKMFRGMEDVWQYYENGRYYYTFGKANSFNLAKGLYHKAVLEGKIKWKYLKSAEIIEIEKDKVISRVKVIELRSGVIE